MNNPLIYLLKNVAWPKKLMIVSIFLTIISSVLSLIIPLLSKRIIDNFKFTIDNVYIIILFILLFLFSSFFNGLSLYLLSKIGETTIYSIREKIWNHLIHLNISFFDKNETGELMSRITEDTSVINSFISERAPTTIGSILTLIGSIIFLLFLDWKLTLVTFSIIPIFLLIIIPLSKAVGTISENTQMEIAKFNSLLSRVISDIRIVKVSTSEEIEMKNSRSNLKEIYKLNLKESKIKAILNPISSIIMMIAIVFILGYGGIRVANGNISAGTLVAMIFYILQLTEPILNISLFIADYQQSKGASIRLFEFYNEPLENYNVNSLTLPKNGNINFDNVTFNYEDGNCVLKNISFTIENNKTTAIVGPSGSGKTTILNLLERFYKPSIGNITLNGMNIYKFNLQEWRNYIGLVMQSNSMMVGTIKDNITYGIRNEVSDEELKIACKKAFCYDFIENFPEKFNTHVGENGIKLSGGQKQRINIAKVFLKDPKLLILDEATSNLDSESERKIQKSIESLSNNKTTVIVAHRLATIKKADKIIFLDNGYITGIGSHNDLYKKHKKYKEFVNSQNIL
ncbi:ABC transporter ATP-binding protein [Staphylococcus hominis]|uniref:ABC transporter ATP-binding protein n=1 Tax=Staphylococcus hominis TaxID=1290 RepID=UPI001F59D8BA|nr:ABC transporter ATP-binding protein [Staphylococcus hominis]MCI2848420.1 ABC transporter ATP-binding protein/permease [Staphylococcus hominis]MCI2850623.1 ABC transporter ATP-binding protein/permease [Staphylococcus hominis]MCI2857178.1 ABC transporter ATP-binding protein/permease [Staphylococcus hominis]